MSADYKLAQIVNLRPPMGLVAAGGAKDLADWLACQCSPTQERDSAIV